MLRHPPCKQLILVITFKFRVRILRLENSPSLVKSATLIFNIILKFFQTAKKYLAFLLNIDNRCFKVVNVGAKAKHVTILVFDVLRVYKTHWTVTYAGTLDVGQRHFTASIKILSKVVVKLHYLVLERVELSELSFF